MPWCMLFTDPPAAEPWYEAWRQNPVSVLPILFGVVTLLLVFGIKGYRALRHRRFKSIPVLDPLQLEQLMHGRAPLLVDLRPVVEFRGPKGHMRGAVNIPLEELGRRLNELERKEPRPIVLIDERDGRARQAALLLQAKGVDWFYVLEGGFHAWRLEHMPTYSGVAHQ